MAKTPVLYSYFRSSASWRVRIALAFKDIEYEYKAVNLVKSENKADYAKLNPMAQVPTLVIDGATLTQSLPIIEYLDETRPEKPLLPKDPLERAKARHIAEIINSGIQPLQNLSVIRRLSEITGNSEDAQTWSKEWITKGFVGLEQYLQVFSKKYSIGEEITLADLFIVPQVANARRFKVDMTAFPTVMRIHAELVQHPAFIAADPLNQPDCPPELKK